MRGKVIARGMVLGIAMLAVNVLLAFAWVGLHSALIDPGHDGAFYQAYAQRVAPVSGLIWGVPLLFAAGWLAAREGQATAALLPAITYLILDIALMAAGNLWSAPLWLLLSYASKLGAAWAGGRIASIRASRT